MSGKGIYPETKFCSAFLRFSLSFILLFIFCGRTKVTTNEKKPILDDAIVDKRFKVLSMDIKYPAGVDFLFLKDIVKIEIKLSCPNLPQELGVSLFLVDSKIDSIDFSKLEAMVGFAENSSENIEQRSEGGVITLEIFPQRFVCQKDYTVSATTVVDAPHPGKYFLITYLFSLSDAKFSYPATEFVITPVYLAQKQEVESYIYKTWLEVFPIEVTGLIDLDAIEDGDAVKIFALTSTGIEILDFFPDILSFGSSRVMQISVSNPISLDSIRGDKISFISVRAEGGVSEVFRYKDKNLYPVGVTLGFGRPFIILDDGNRYYLTYSGCGTVWEIDEGIKNLNFGNCEFISTKKNKFFMFYRYSGGWHIKVFPLSGTSGLNYGILTVGYDTFSEQEDGFYFYDEYTYYKGGVTEVKIIDIYKMEADNLTETNIGSPITYLNRISMDAISPHKSIEYYSFLPLYKDRVLLVPRFEHSPSPATIYVVSPAGVETEKTLPTKFYPFQFFARKANFTAFILYNYFHMHILIFNNEKLILDYNLDFYGVPIDFVSDDRKTVIVIKLSSNRLGFLTLERKGESVSADFKYIPAIVERYEIFLVSPDLLFTFFTDSGGCWTQNLCRGDEFLYIKAGKLQSTERFFSHQSPTLQSLRRIIFHKGDPLVLIRDRNKIRVFIRK